MKGIEGSTLRIEEGVEGGFGNPAINFSFNDEGPD